MVLNDWFYAVWGFSNRQMNGRTNKWTLVVVEWLLRLKNLMKLTSIKILDIKKFFWIFIQRIYLFSFNFPLNFFNKSRFFLKNLQNLWPKIFEALKIFQLLDMFRRQRWRCIFCQKSLKNKDLQSFVETLLQSYYLSCYCNGKAGY